MSAATTLVNKESYCKVRKCMCLARVGVARPGLSGPRVVLSPDLHLVVAMRSFRAETLSSFISHVVDGDAEAARAAFAGLDLYPIVLSRDVDEARAWLKTKARGSERYGLVASSGTSRLKAEGLNVKAAIEPPNWFLNGRDDVPSSFYLEDRRGGVPD